MQTIYTGLAPLYDALVPFLSSCARTTGQNWLAVQDGETVLDVGTGTGLAFKQLVAANPSGWTEGVDSTTAMLRRTRRKLTDIPHCRYGLRQADAAALPYPTDAFDAVFASYVVDVLPAAQMRPALQEIRRVLHPNGRSVLVTLAPPQQLLEQVWGSLARYAWPLLGGDRPIDSRRLLQSEGFAVIAHSTRRQAALRSAVTKAYPVSETVRTSGN